MAVKPIPEGFHSVTPYLMVPNCVKALEWYEKAFGAKTISRMPGPGGSTMHAEMRIGDSRLMLSDENPQWNAKSPKTLGGTPVSLHLYVQDVDAAFSQAQAAGCEVTMPPGQMFWGDRYCKIIDPFGHMWGIATRTEDVSPQELARRQEEMLKQMSQA
jgi:PhnB protein